MSAPTRSQQTKLNFKRVLHSFFGFALKNKYVAANPVTDITIRVEGGDPGILTIEQAQCLLFAAMDNPQLELGPFATLGLFCGIRSEELPRLDWRDVNLSEGFVTISKRIAKKRRIITLGFSAGSNYTNHDGLSPDQIRSLLTPAVVLP